MAVQITDENFEQYLAQYTRALETEGEVKGVTIITNPDSIRNTLTLPGVNYDINPISNPNAIARDYVQIPYSALADTLDDMNAVAERVETAVTEANNVNAELDGMTVIITNRKGQERSVNMAFDIYDSYKSIAEMNAHLADIPNGGLASIATDDPTDSDNAKLYQKRSDGTLAYIGDLDQASSEAWADWLNNKKPQIEDATDAANAAADRVDDCIATANQDHIQAVTDHTTAVSDHTTATTDHTTAQSDHTQAASDTSRAATDHTAATSDHTTATSDHTTAAADHVTASQDTLTAQGDHTQASADHTQAVQDHAIASTDHITATSDTEQAATDHQTATDDHAQYATDHQTFLTNEAQRQSDFDDAQTERNTTWTSWFSDSLSTGVRKLWNDFWSNINSSWNGFFGTSADDPNGVRKIWTTWYSSTQSSWNAFWPAAKNTWESWFGTSSSTGVQGEWADLKSDAEQDHTTATSDHAIASSDHTQAVQDHTTAGTDHGVAESDHTQATNDHTASVAATANANEQASYAENVASHPSYIADGTQEKPGDIGYVYQWDYAHQQYVRGIRVSLDWDTMSQEEKDALAAEVLASIAFDEVPTPDSNKAVRSSGVYTALQGKSGIDHTHDLKDLGDDEMHRLVTDDEKRSWNSKQSALTFATEVTCESIVGELT